MQAETPAFRISQWVLKQHGVQVLCGCAEPKGQPNRPLLGRTGRKGIVVVCQTCGYPVPRKDE